MKFFDQNEYKKLTSKLDDLLRKQDAMTCAQIDSSATGSQIDYRNKKEKETEFYKLKSEFEGMLRDALSRSTV